MGGGGQSTTNPIIPQALLQLLQGTTGNVVPNQNRAWQGGPVLYYTDAAGNKLQVGDYYQKTQELKNAEDAMSRLSIEVGADPSRQAELDAAQAQYSTLANDLGKYGEYRAPGGTPEFMQKQNYEDYFGRPGEGANYTPDTAYAALEQAMGGQGIEGFASPSVYEGIAASSALQNPLAGGPSLQALGERTPDLSTLTNNPMVTNAMKTWSDVQLPTLQNQASLMGLGRSSSLLKGIGASKNAFMLPIMQQAAGYESEAIGRGQQGATTEAANALTAQQNQFGNLFNLSNADTQRKLAASQQLTSMAGTERDWAKERGNFALQDQLRRQALGENLLFQPLGGTASMVGSTTSGGK